MIDVNLSVVANADHDQSKVLTPMQEIDDAYRACSFGKFHLKLICVAFLGSISGILVTNTTSYLLPIAECDLRMDLVQKGFLNAAPFLGMSVTSLVAGFLTDNFGRKLFLKVGFGGLFVFNIVAGSSQTYEVLVIAKFIQGMFFATSISAHVTFISEFCHKGIRDRMLLCQSSFIAIGQIISPAMALGILTQEWTWSMFDGYIVLHTWNFYLYAMSLWSLSACIFYSTLPESPKYLVTKQKYTEARDILIKMYKENTGKPAETYPHINIWINLPSQDMSGQKDKGFRHEIIAGLHNARPLFRKPLIIYVIMLGSMSCFLLAIYNIVRLWFPQLSTIVEHHKIDEDNDLCSTLDNYTSNLKIVRSNTTSPEVCIPNKSGPETYINSMIIGLVCLSQYCISGVLVTKVGKKSLQVSAGLIGIGATLGLRWASSKFAVVALFAVDTAILQVMKSLNQATAVEYFPTNIRSFALACTMMTGRVGTLSGNIGFPLLLDMGCIFPFFIMAGLLIVVTTMSLFMPKKKQS